MKLCQARLEPYTLRLTRPLRTARGGFVDRRGWLLRLEDDAGRQGAGDAAPWPGFGNPPEVVQAALQALVPRLVDMHFADAAALETWRAAATLPAEVAHAVELAVLDLLAQAQGVPLARLLSPAPAAQVPVHVLVPNGIAAKDAVQAGAQTLKIKLGGRALDDEVGHVAGIRAAVGDKIALRLDANGAWPREVAVKAAKLLSSFAPEWLEQPVPADDVEGLKQIRDLRAVPIAADESVQTLAGLQAVLQAQAADVIVLKPMFVGGLQPAQRHASLAAEHGVRCVVTHALESAVGRMGAAHLAAALGGATAGLANPLAQDADVTEGPKITRALWTLPSTPGLGLAW